MESEIVSFMVALVMPLYVLSFTILYRQGKLATLCNRFDNMQEHCKETTGTFAERIGRLEDANIYQKGLHNGKHD